MAFYGSGYMQGIGQGFTPITGSPQAGVGNAPMASGYNTQPTGPTVDSKTSAQPSVQDQIQPNPLTNLTNSGYAGAIDEQKNLAQLPAWASQYVAGQNGGNLNSAQLNDAYYGSAPTLSNIYSQYGGGFDPSKFTGLGDGTLQGLQGSLGAKGYGLDNIGGYYQDQSLRYGPQAGVDYRFDPTFGVTGAIGGLNFDVLQAPGGQMMSSRNPLKIQGMPYGQGQSWTNVAQNFIGPNSVDYGNSVENLWSKIAGINPSTQRQFEYAGSGIHYNPGAVQGAYHDPNARYGVY